MNRYGDFIRIVSKPELDETPVNLGVKVLKYRRQYWAAQSKMEGMSLTSGSAVRYYLFPFDPMWAP